MYGDHETVSDFLDYGEDPTEPLGNDDDDNDDDDDDDSNHDDNDSSGSKGVTPIHLAAHGGHSLVVKVLLERGNVDVNLAMQDGVTSLWLAASRGHLHCTQLLLSIQGVDVDIAREVRCMSHCRLHM